MELLFSLFVTIAAFSAFWALHLRLKNAGVVDLYWGAGFVVIGGIYLLHSGPPNTYQSVMMAMIVIWAVRLSVYLVRRFSSSPHEDARYTAMRVNSGSSYWWTSLPKIFVLQAVAMWIIATPLHTALTLSVDELYSGPLLGVGIILFCIGLSIEAIADHQLASFKRQTPSTTEILRSGLWRLSRHPNYFGEAIIWWGLGIYAFALTGSLVSLIGPMALTIILVGVTGKLTDEYLQESRGEAFLIYRRETSGFLPLPPGFYQKFTKKHRSVT